MLRARMTVTVMTSAALFLAASGLAVADAPTREGAVLSDCETVNAFLEVQEENVRAHVPEAFEPYGEGASLVFVHPFRCKSMTSHGGSGEMIAAYFAAVIERPPGSDSVGCSVSSQLGGNEDDQTGICDWYLFFAVSNNRHFVNWLREIGLGEKAVYVPDLVYDYQPENAGVNFRFSAPPPTPSPFEMTGVLAQAPAEGTASPMANWWDDLSGGSSLRITAPNEGLGTSWGTVVVTPQPETAMAQMFGTSSKVTSNPLVSGAVDCVAYRSIVLEP